MNNMSEINWQDFLNILTLKGLDTGITGEVSSDADNGFKICYNANRSYLEEWLGKKVKEEKKSCSKSVEFRLSGNKVYQKGNDWEALIIYNLSVTQAPFNTNEFSLALSNRSAVLARLGVFSEAIRDIDLALEHGDDTIPRNKLLTRKAILLHKLNQYEDSLKLINTLFPDVKEIFTHENKELKNAYEDSLLKTSQNQPAKKIELEKIIPSPKDGENKSFPSASTNVSLKCSKEKGRFVVAKESFDTADILFVEKPFALVVLPDQYHKHCHHCCKDIVAYVPCKECTRAFFCSDTCRTSAWSTYHQWECKGLEVCHSIGIAHLGLRVALLADSSDKYKQVFDLLTHMDIMEAEDLYQYTVTAVLLTLYLKNYTSYFESNPTITFKEMGTRILRHIAQLVCNGHAITKIDATESVEGYSKTLGEAQTRIATAIYPTVSMMNHSCDHNILNSFINEYLVVRASRVIKKDEEIFNCYGPHYSHENTEERQKMLQSQYFFKCECARCCNPDDWEQEQFSALLCSFCSGPVMQDQDKCADCHRRQPLLEMVNLALTAQKLHHHSQQLVKQRHLKEALPVLEECVQISSKCLYKHNSDLRTYKDSLARVYAEMGRFGESIGLVEDCIVSIEKQFGSGIELINELQKLITLLQSDLKQLVDSGLRGSREFSEKLEKLKRIHVRAKNMLPGTVNSAYLNSIPSMIEALEEVELM